MLYATAATALSHPENHVQQQAGKEQTAWMTRGGLSRLQRSSDRPCHGRDQQGLDRQKIHTDFGQDTEAQWMAAHCAEYGFIIRYPEGKEDITKIHLRAVLATCGYVGVEAARDIMQNG
jgi:D-alanyl-D-alanine carboxypeptidase